MNKTELQFKIGDKVEIVGPTYDFDKTYIGKEGLISYIDFGGDYRIEDFPAVIFQSKSLELLESRETLLSNTPTYQIKYEVDGVQYVKEGKNLVPFVPSVKKPKLKVGDIVEFINEDDHLIADEIIDISGDVYETIDYSDLKAGELKLIKSPERLKDNDYVITTQKNIYRVAEVGHQYYLFCAFNGVGAGNTELNSLPYLNSEGYYVIGGYQYKPIAIEKTEEE